MPLPRQREVGSGEQPRKAVDCGCAWSPAGNVLAKKSLLRTIVPFFFCWNISGCASTSRHVGATWRVGRITVEGRMGGMGWVGWSPAVSGGQVGTPRTEGPASTPSWGITEDRPVVSPP